MHESITRILEIFLGAALGIPSGICLNHIWTRRADGSRRNQFIVAMKNTLQSNQRLLGEVENYLKSGSIPYFNVDLTLLDSTATIKYELISDVDLCAKLDYLRYELGHVARKVDLLLRISLDPTAIAAKNNNGECIYNKMWPILSDAIREHLPQLQKTIDELRPQLDAASRGC